MIHQISCSSSFSWRLALWTFCSTLPQDEWKARVCICGNVHRDMRAAPWCRGWRKQRHVPPHAIGCQPAHSRLSCLSRGAVKRSAWVQALDKESTSTTTLLDFKDEVCFAMMKHVERSNLSFCAAGPASQRSPPSNACSYNPSGSR